MAAFAYDSFGDHYPFATTATVVFYIDQSSCASTWYMPAQTAEFIPGRRQPVWADAPRAPKRSLMVQYSAPTQRMFIPRTASSRCQVGRQKRRMRIQSLI